MHEHLPKKCPKMYLQLPPGESSHAENSRSAFRKIPNPAHR